MRVTPPEWQRWFAWFPIQLNMSGRRVWWVYVYRRKSYIHTGQWQQPVISYYQYRLIDPTEYEEMDQLLGKACECALQQPVGRLVK